MKKKEIEHKVFTVRKNHIDASAGMMFSLGCSLVHLSMLIANFTVKPTNCEEAKKLDSEYLDWYTKNLAIETPDKFTII